VIPSRLATSEAFVLESVMAAIAIFNVSTVIFRGLPPKRPRALAAAKPALVRSLINSASTAGHPDDQYITPFHLAWNCYGMIGGLSGIAAELQQLLLNGIERIRIEACRRQNRAAVGLLYAYKDVASAKVVEIIGKEFQTFPLDGSAVDQIRYVHRQRHRLFQVQKVNV
jgi:hypothetical protein